MVVQALAETGVEPRQAVVIGDTSFDMEMARAAGAWAVGVTWGNHPRDHLEFSGAHHIVNNFKALDDTLELLWEVRPQ
jgi:phosphoglycolate phosphatase